MYFFDCFQLVSTLGHHQKKSLCKKSFCEKNVFLKKFKIIRKRFDMIKIDLVSYPARVEGLVNIMEVPVG